MAPTVAIRRRLGGGALVLSALFNWAAALVEPRSTETKAADVLATIAAHTDRVLASSVLDMIGTVLFLPAVLTIVHLLTPRAPKLAHIGGAMAIAGLFGFMGMHVLDAALVELVKGGADREQMAALYDRFQNNPGIGLAVGMFLVGQVFGFLILSIGLFRTRSLPRWIPPLTWVFLLWDVGCGVSGIDPQIGGIIDPHMVGFVGAAALGILVLRQSDEAWERGEPLTMPTSAERAGPVTA